MPSRTKKKTNKMHIVVAEVTQVKTKPTQAIGRVQGQAVDRCLTHPEETSIQRKIHTDIYK